MTGPLRSPYDRRTIFVPNCLTKSCYDRMIIEGSPCGARAMPLRRAYGPRSYDLKNCKSADYYKIVEATQIVHVGSRRIVGSSTLQTPHAENAKIGIARSSHANRRPNVTYSPADIQLDPEMWFKHFFLADSCCLDVTTKESD